LYVLSGLSRTYPSIATAYCVLLVNESAYHHMVWPFPRIRWSLRADVVTFKILHRIGLGIPAHCMGGHGGSKGNLFPSPQAEELSCSSGFLLRFPAGCSRLDVNATSTRVRCKRSKLRIVEQSEANIYDTYVSVPYMSQHKLLRVLKSSTGTLKHEPKSSTFVSESETLPTLSTNLQSPWHQDPA
jgi:hypothetical protein